MSFASVLSSTLHLLFGLGYSKTLGEERGEDDDYHSLKRNSATSSEVEKNMAWHDMAWLETTCTDMT